MQRFSGSGLAPRTRVRRQERRARRATIGLAALAVVLIAASAVLLFDPAIELPSFGFALGERLHKLASDIPLFVDGTQPPTDTPSETPSGGDATPTQQPTTTPRPTFTPTPVPTAIPSGAIVSFKQTAAQSVSSNGAMTACGSGCTFATKSTSGQSQGSATQGWVSGYHGSAWNVSVTAKLNSTQYCTIQPATCPSSGKSVFGWPGTDYNTGTTPRVEFYDSRTGFDCVFPVGALSVGSTTTAGSCTFSYGFNVIGGNQLPGSTFQGSVTSVAWTASDTYINGYFSFWSNASPCASNCYYEPTDNDCTNVKNAAHNNGSANTDAQNRINGWATANGLLGQQSTWSWAYAGGACSPAPWNPGSSVTGYAYDNYSASAFSPQDAKNIASQRVAAQLPQGDYWISGPNTCSLTWGYAGSGRFNVTCADSGTAQYDWRTTSTLGQTAIANLQKSIAGKSLSAALDICNGRVSPYTSGYPGILAGSCTIQLVGGNVSVIPSDTAKIQILPN